jgi:hypothetical protein
MIWRFKNSQIEFAAQVSAVAATAGASANVKYAEGVMVYDAKVDSCTRHQLVDNSLSLLNCKALLLSVATSCIM